MKSLVLAEKPSVGKDIARVLHCRKPVAGGLEGEHYIVTWAYGHLVTLADPEQYEDRYKTWRMEDLPMLPNQMKLEVIRQTGKQYHAVKELLMRKDVGQVIIATDAGREGELVARLILLKSGCRKPLKRLWISSVTDKAIKEGFQNLKDGSAYENLYRAAMSRAEADWLVGINATRALTCRYNAQLSCGRVQTPTLAMIEDREQKIKEFRPQTYYGIQAVCHVRDKSITLTWQSEKGMTSSFDEAYIQKTVERLQQQNETVYAEAEQVKKTAQLVPAPALYDLTELQRDANKKFQYSAKQTLNIMQRLYETHKVLTYPRTDSRYLTKDILGTIKERLRACSTGPYKALGGPLLAKPLPDKPAFVNDAKVSDHHAIIPTEQYVDLAAMSVEERRIYDLVIRRFFAVMYPPARYENVSVKMKIGSETFTAKGKIIQDMGWRAVYENGEGEEGEESGQKIPSLEKGQRFPVIKLSVTKGQTKPPAAFTEATLLSAMENPIPFLKENRPKEAAILKETGGLGTVATRADIIEKLFSGFLIEKKGNELHTTAKARQLLKLVPEDLKKPELTADWEGKLSSMAKGKLDRRLFMGEIREYTKELVNEIKDADGQFRHDNLTNKKCPRCGKRMLAVNGKNAKLLVCQDRECGYRETVSRTSNARCPVCHKKMELSGKGEDAVFFCSCGYREKLKKFKERREREGGGVSKKDVARYMKQQQKEAQEPVNTIFADALKNWKR